MELSALASVAVAEHYHDVLSPMSERWPQGVRFSDSGPDPHDNITEQTGDYPRQSGLADRFCWPIVSLWRWGEEQGCCVSGVLASLSW